MKEFSNLYILGFTSALVLFVAAALSFTSLTLKPQQHMNVEIERQQNILTALGIKSTSKDIAEKYNQYIKQSIVIKTNGDIVDGESAERINLKKENEKPVEDRLYPLYFAEKDGLTFIVIPLSGAGMWGPIWGNMVVENDMNTIYGATFDHKRETPGLGAEINTPAFGQQFHGKMLFDKSDVFTCVKVKKPGSYMSNEHTVDAISGGTITCDGLEKMLETCIKPYQTYLLQHKPK